MSTELLEQIMDQMSGLRSNDLHVIEKHAVLLRRSRRVHIGQTYEVSDFPKGDRKEEIVILIRVLEEDSNILFAKHIYESGTFTCLVDDDEKRTALQSLIGMGCLVVETKL